MERIGAQHQAGSDSLVTGRVFFRVYDLYFSDGLDDVKYSGNKSEASSLLTAGKLDPRFDTCPYDQ